MLVISIILSISVALISFFSKGYLDVVSNAYGFAIPFAIFIPYIIFKKSSFLQKNTTRKWLDYLNYAAFIFILASAPGSLYFHRGGIQYDRVLHFICAFAGFFMFSLFLLPFFRPDEKKISKKLFIFIIALITLAGLFAWEGFQFSLDAIFGTKVFFDISQPIIVDFWEDIFFGTCGTILAIAYMNHIFDKFLEKILVKKIL